MRFHESLRGLADVATEMGIPLDRETVIVRDGVGRLILCREKIESPAHVETALRQRLGGYAAPVVIITGSPAKKLLADPRVNEVEVTLSSGWSGVIRYADRRVVGMDWLQSPAAPSPGPKRLVFGSLKGGVGRSTALAVLAADLARAGKKVLAIDLDLEAPGIGFLLLPGGDDPSQDRRPLFGVVDYLLENSVDGIADEDLYDFIGVSPFTDSAIDVIPAVGRITDDYPETMIAKLSRALVEDREAGRTVPVTQQIREMIDRFVKRGEYDAVLIDARAGMAEISAAPMLGLGGEILLFGTDQPQTIRGYAYILAHLVSVSDFSQMPPDCDWRSRLSFVQAKAPSALSKRSNFRDQLYELCASILYDKEQLEDGRVAAPAEFSPGPNETGRGVPHDALFVQFHPDYDAFDPIGDRTQLDPEVYRGPFGAFLERAWELLELRREGV